jgi:hypothetical protein
MGGICLVGLSGSMIKNAVNATQPFGCLDVPPADEYEAAKILIGIFFIIFAQIL